MARFNGLTYAIVPKAALQHSQVAQCRNHNPALRSEAETIEQLRTSLDGNKVIVKYDAGDGEDRGWVDTIPGVKYTHEEILTFLNGNEDWELPSPII